jgi:hypothetical protein
MGKKNNRGIRTGMCRPLVILILLITLLFLHGPIQAHNEQPVDLSDVGITPQPGHSIPLNLIFNEEKGNTVNLRQYVRAPRILALVYLHCPNA